MESGRRRCTYAGKPSPPERLLESWEHWEAYNSNYWALAMYHFKSLRRLYILPAAIPVRSVCWMREFVPPMPVPNLQYSVLTDWFPFYVDLVEPDSDDRTSKVRPFHLVYADWRGVPILEEFLPPFTWAGLTTHNI